MMRVRKALQMTFNVLKRTSARCQIVFVSSGQVLLLYYCCVFCVVIILFRCDVFQTSVVIILCIISCSCISVVSELSISSPACDLQI